MMNTNGNGGARKKPELFAQIVEAGITDLMFSVDACDPETYHRQRVGGSWEILLNSVRSAVRARAEGKGAPDCRIRASVVRTHLNAEAVDSGRMEEFWKGKMGVDWMSISECYFPAGTQHHWKAARVAPDERGRVPVLRPLPPHGRDLGRPPHHALLPGLHARDRRRPRGGACPAARCAACSEAWAERELRPPARRAPRSAPGTDPAAAASPSAAPAR